MCERAGISTKRPVGESDAAPGFWKADLRRRRRIVVRETQIPSVRSVPPSSAREGKSADNLFIAIQNSDVEMVKSMLVLGADPRVEFYGTTPLQKAVATINLIGYRPGWLLGDRFKDKHDRATEVLRLLREAGAEGNER
jgi:hypothetical protein